MRKRVMLILISALLVLCLLAGCGSVQSPAKPEVPAETAAQTEVPEEPATETPAEEPVQVLTEVPTEVPTEAPAPAPEEPEEETYGGWDSIQETWAPVEEDPGPRIVEAGTLNKHENGWYQNLDNGTDGVYFNLWTNDVPADNTWHVRYEPTLDSNFYIVRDGELLTDVSCRILKFNTTGHFLVCDPWLLGAASPLRAGDYLIIQGDFVDYDSGWGLHFDTTYIKLKGVDNAKFYTSMPEELEDILLP